MRRHGKTVVLSSIVLNATKMEQAAKSNPVADAAAITDAVAADANPFSASRMAREGRFNGGLPIITPSLAAVYPASIGSRGVAPISSGLPC